MIHKYALGFLIPPALLLAVGWVALQTQALTGVAFLAFVGTPAAVMVLGWAAVVANDSANRRSERRPQAGSIKVLLVYPLAPAGYLLAGWTALHAGYINEAWFVAVSAAPAAVLLLAWAALVASEVANKRSTSRRRHD